MYRVTQKIWAVPGNGSKCTSSLLNSFSFALYFNTLLDAHTIKSQYSKIHKNNRMLCFLLDITVGSCFSVFFLQIWKIFMLQVVCFWNRVSLYQEPHQYRFLDRHTAPIIPIPYFPLYAGRYFIIHAWCMISLSCLNF